MRAPWNLAIIQDMAHPSSKKSPPTTGQMLLEEVRELRDAIDELHDAVDKLNPKFAKKATNWLLGGMIRGLGLLIGTTLVAAIVLFGLREILTSKPVQKWTGEQIQEFLNNSFDGLTPVEVEQALLSE